MNLAALPPCLAAVLVAAIAPLASAVAQTTIAVNATQSVRTVDDRLFGVNAVMWDGLTNSAQTISLLKAADVRMFRIPGGSVSDEYHWKVNRSLANTWTWSAGTNKFVDLITGVGAQTTAVVNYGTGTPEEAAAWVAYFNSSATLQGTSADVSLGNDVKGENWQTAGYWSKLRASAPLATDDGSNFLRMSRAATVGVKYWEIGNECYGTWETDQQAVQHDPYTYAVRVKDYIAKMKAVDPTIRIGVVVVTGEDSNVNNRNHPATNPRTGVVHNGWTPVVLATLASLGVTPDALVYHRYEQTPGKETDAALLQLPKTWSADAADLRQQLTDYLGAAGANVELVVTENNSVYTDPGKQSTSVVNALFYADALGNILQTEFNEFLWWALRNGTPTNNGALLGNMSSSLYGWRQYGDYGIISTPNTFGQTSSNEPYPTYYAMKLTSHFARGGDTVVKATSSSTLLAAYAAKRSDGTLTLLVVNKSPTDDTTATISIAGFLPKATATVYSYGVPQDDAARTGSGSADVATTTLSSVGASFSATFAHYTASVISFTAAAPEIVVQPSGAATGTGANVVLSVAATGVAPLSYQWQKDGVAIAGATSTALSLPAVTTASAGSYVVTIRDGNGTALASAPATVSVSATPYVAPAASLVNISTRAQVGTGGNVMIAGFTIGGAGSKKVLIRAVGPALATYGVDGTLADPQLEVTTLAGASIAVNDDWSSGNTADIAAASTSVGAFALPASSKDSALVLTLPAGGYTAIVKGANNGTGVALVEVYDLDRTSAARLTNLSTRAQVGTGAQALIGGVAVVGSAPRKLLIRAIGPTLGTYGVSGTLADPVLTLTTQAGASVASNDDWETPNGPAITAATAQTGAFALNAGGKDAALLVSLPQDNYSGKIEGKSGGTGVALIEVYEAP